MNNIDASPFSTNDLESTAYEKHDLARECEPPFLMLAANLISESDLQSAIYVAHFARISIGRVLVMQGIVTQSSLDLAIEISHLLRGRRLRRGKAIEMLRFEGEMVKLQIAKGSVIRPLQNPLMNGLQGVCSMSNVFCSF